VVTSPQDHWKIKERSLNLEGKRKDKTEIEPIKESFWKKWQFFFKKRDKTKVSRRCQGGVSQTKERGEKDRCKVDERGEG
jgi:hypothetical protein